MYPVNRSEMKKLDDLAIKEAGIPCLLCMENAGKAVSQYLVTSLPKAKNCVVVCGKGNNGGDGLVAARHLFAQGLSVSVFLLCKETEIHSDAKTNLDIIRRLKIQIEQVVDSAGIMKLREALRQADAVIDAIFGIGFQGAAEGIFAEAIDLINGIKQEKNYFVLSVDIPSGLDADSGEVGSHCVRANTTVTFTYPKRGMLLYPAIDLVGKLSIVDIGIPKANPLAKGQEAPQAAEKTTKIDGSEIITPALVKSKIPPRLQSAHKGTTGTVFVLAGSIGMSGAAVMTSRSALRVGAGLVKAGVPKSIRPEVAAGASELITVALSETADGTLALKALDKVMDNYRKCDSMIVGPGLSTNTDTSKLVKALLNRIKAETNKVPVVVDADALNCISDDPSILRSLGDNVIVTPHPGEMARLTRSTAEAVQKDRAGLAGRFAKDFGVTVVLKGARTVVAASDGRTFINLTGNPGMASAGMGDVLAGAIAGFIAQKMSVLDAALCGVFVHGMAGDVISSLKGEHGIIAGDIIETLPYVIRSILQ